MAGTATPSSSFHRLQRFREASSRIAQEREGQSELLDHRLVGGRGFDAYDRQPEPALLELFALPGIADQLDVLPKVQNDLSYGFAPS
jgi:hypothetical protein